MDEQQPDIQFPKLTRQQRRHAGRKAQKDPQFAAFAERWNTFSPEEREQATAELAQHGLSPKDLGLT